MRVDSLGDLASGLKLVGTVIFGYLLLLWLASILWAYRDIRSRTTDTLSQLIGVGVVALMPLAGVAIYLIVRPAETLEDQYERELEQEAIRSELQALSPCPNCHRPVEREFIVCAYCRTQLRDECPRCRKLLSLDWRHCPYCGTSRAPRPEPVRAQRPTAPAFEEPEEQPGGWMRGAGDASARRSRRPDE
jgi:hypothetical protein